MIANATGLPEAHPLAILHVEKRLGRLLSEAERSVDIIGIDRDLHYGKLALTDTIETEKRRALTRALDGGPGILHVTQPMVDVLNGLYEAGQQHAHDEIRRLVGHVYAERKIRKLSPIAHALRLLLTGISARVSVEVDRNVEVRLLERPFTKELLDLLDKRIPGARDAASRLVSSALYSGIGSVYEEEQGLFVGFVYSAMMDATTCERCAQFDGDEYDSWAQAERVLPNGGPNPLCYGDGRCRCRLVPVLR